jgi:hypothetical protein
VTRPKRTRTPAPARTTCSATKGWSSRTAATTSGTPAASASHTVLWPPWQMTRSTRRSTATCGTRGTTSTLGGGSGTTSRGAAITTCTSSRPRASAATAKKRAPARQLTVPSVTSTTGRSPPSQSQGNGVPSGRTPTAGPTSAQWSGNGPAAPTSSLVVKASTRWGEKRGSTGAATAGSTPASTSSPCMRRRSHSPTLGMPARGSTRSAELVADVAHTSPALSATAAPASACWSATTTSGPKAWTARAVPGTMSRPMGSTNSSQNERKPAAPVSGARLRTAMASTTPWGARAATGMNAAPAGSSAGVTSG